MPDPEKIEDLPQNVYSKKVIKIQYTRTVETIRDTAAVKKRAKQMMEQEDGQIKLKDLSN